MPDETYDLFMRVVKNLDPRVPSEKKKGVAPLKYIRQTSKPVKQTAFGDLLGMPVPDIHKVLKIITSDKHLDQLQHDTQAESIAGEAYLLHMNTTIEIYKQRITLRSWLTSALAYFKENAQTTTFEHPLWMNDGFPGEEDSWLKSDMSPEVRDIIRAFPQATSSTQAAACVNEIFESYPESHLVKGILNVMDRHYGTRDKIDDPRKELRELTPRPLCPIIK